MNWRTTDPLMARQRFVKPDVFQHAELHDAQAESGLPLILAYIGLWCQCDRRGCFEWRPKVLKLHIMPFDPIDFEAVLTALERAGFVRRYDVDGRPFGYVPTFERHQHIHPKEAANRLIPDPPDYCKTTGETRTSLELAAANASCMTDKTVASLELTTDETMASPSASNRYRYRASNTAIPSDTDTDTAVLTEPRGGSVGGATRSDRSTASARAEQLVDGANAAVQTRFNGAALLKAGSHALELVHALDTAGISIETAIASMGEQMECYTRDKPPRSVRYFTPGILRAGATPAYEPLPAKGRQVNYNPPTPEPDPAELVAAATVGAMMSSLAKQLKPQQPT